MQENLAEILAGREERVAAQEVLMREFSDCTLVCFTLNIAGGNKTFPLAKMAFLEGSRAVKNRFVASGIEIVHFEEATRASGYEAYFAVHKNALAVKRLTSLVEENHPLGRLFDIDVLGEYGEKISRTELGLPPRKCLLCENSAVVCARSRKHSAAEVVHRTCEIIENYFAEKFGSQISELAVKALLNEVCVTPKPGLVDRNNSGSHSDMNVFTFMDSAAALGNYFGEITLAGVKFGGDIGELLELVRPLGVQAESQMRCATNGVNTHMGAVYSLGILCTACGYLYKNNTEITVESVLQTVAEIAVNEGDFGARAEAKNGFESVRKLSLPRLEACLLAGYSWNNACCAALAALMANITDSNIISRSNECEAEIMRQKAAEIAQKAIKIGEKAFIFALEKLDDEYISKNLSPGGAADLLAVTIFLHFIEKTNFS